MAQLSISYGILNDNNNQINHILPITKILYIDNVAYITSSRDGSIIWHDRVNPANNFKLQVHSDWISDILLLKSHQNNHYLLSVSHDFSINLIHIYSTNNNNNKKWKANAKIIGYHQDYIKSVQKLNENTFVTVGLDNYINIWSIDIHNSSTTHHFKSFVHPHGSLYALQCIQYSSHPFDIIVADCNGNIAFYSSSSSSSDRPVSTLLNAHNTNIKCIKLFDNNSLLISTCSNGIVKVWDMANNKIIPLTTFKWPNAVIWSIQHDDSNPQSTLIVADSAGNISTLQFDRTNNQPLIKSLYHNNLNTSTHKGIITAVKSNNQLKFSICSNSNLNTIDLSQNNKLSVENGGIALTRSSLLTNRRHVITENSNSIVQQWDIISCQLINTFDPNEGTFDQIVKKYTSHEILPHWCTVSIKVGILFIKITFKNFNNTEVYGNALKQYTLLNENCTIANINDEYRYNLGKIVIHSLFNQFMQWEINKDTHFRSKLISNLDKDKDTHDESQHSKRKSAFNNLSLSTSHFKSKDITPTTNNTPFVSAPSTPIGELNDTAPNDYIKLHHKSHEDLLTTATDSKINNSRALSSGSIFTRKFRALRNSNKINQNTNSDRPHTTSGTPINIDSQIDFNYNIFKSTNNSHQSLPESSTSSLASSSSLPSPPPPPPPHSNSMSSPSLPLTNNNNNNNNSTDSKLFMLDLINDIHESYINQLQNQSSLAKLSITKRKIDSQIKTDDDIPIIKINSKTLLLVQSWNEGACGGKVLFSTVLPLSTSTSTSTLTAISSSSSSSILQNNLSSTSLISTTSSISSLESSLDVTSLSSKNSNVSFKSTSSNNGNLINKKIHHGNKKLFTKIERNLPYWVGELLCKDNNLVQEKQPRLNFIILPWTPEDQQDSIGDALPQVPSHQNHHHHPGFKLGKSKSNELIKSSMTDLPKISESNIKLIAPGMVKVKKIKNYVVDRFESKTPEMKEKLEPSIWLELLCKDQLLDNDMTLSTVRTLFWKSQGEIKIYYRRKVPN
ncbi:DUB-associated factor 1 [Monosporozyma servazzii]